MSKAASSAKARWEARVRKIGAANTRRMKALANKPLAYRISKAGEAEAKKIRSDTESELAAAKRAYEKAMGYHR